MGAGALEPGDMGPFRALRQQPPEYALPSRPQVKAIPRLGDEAPLSVAERVKVAAQANIPPMKKFVAELQALLPRLEGGRKEAAAEALSWGETMLSQNEEALLEAEKMHPTLQPRWNSLYGREPFVERETPLLRLDNRAEVISAVQASISELESLQFHLDQAQEGLPPSAAEGLPDMRAWTARRLLLLNLRLKSLRSAEIDGR